MKIIQYVIGILAAGVLVAAEFSGVDLGGETMGLLIGVASGWLLPSPTTIGGAMKGKGE